MPWCPKCKNEYQDGYKVCYRVRMRACGKYGGQKCHGRYGAVPFGGGRCQEVSGLSSFCQDRYGLYKFRGRRGYLCVMVGAGQASRARSLFREYREEMLNNSGVEESPVPPSGNKIYIKKKNSIRKCDPADIFFSCWNCRYLFCSVCHCRHHPFESGSCDEVYILHRSFDPVYRFHSDRLYFHR